VIAACSGRGSGIGTDSNAIDIVDHDRTSLTALRNELPQLDNNTSDVFSITNRPADNWSTCVCREWVCYWTDALLPLGLGFGFVRHGNPLSLLYKAIHACVL